MDKRTAVESVKSLLVKIVGVEKMREAVLELPTLYRVDPTRVDDVYNVIDGLIDIFYYVCDGCVRTGLHHIIDNVYLRNVRNFTFGAFAKEGVVPVKVTDALNSTMEFVIKMCATEVVEIMAPTATTAELSPIIEQWLVDIDNDASFRPISVHGLVITVSKLLDEIIRMFPSVDIFNRVFTEVHRANMDKGRVGSDGVVVFETRIEGGKSKIVKPADWVAPDIKKALSDIDLSDWYNPQSA